MSVEDSQGTGKQIIYCFLFQKTIQEIAQAGEDELLLTLIREKGNTIDVNGLRIPLHEACWHGHLAVVKVLLQEPCGTDVNLKTFPLLLAAWAGHHAIVEELLAHPSTDPNLTDAFQTTALHKACEKGNIESVRALLTSKTLDANMKDYFGATPLYLCVRKGNIEITRLLMLDKRADPNLEAKHGKWTPMRRVFLRIHFPESLDILTILLEDERTVVDLQFARHMADENQSSHAFQLAYLLCKYKNFLPQDILDEKSPKMMELQKKLKLLRAKSARRGKLPPAKKMTLNNISVT